MENASKALIIAGAILLAILLISLGIMIFTQAQDTVNTSGMSQAELQAFNNKFLKYEGTKKGVDVKALINEVLASNADDNNSNRKVQVKKLAGGGETAIAATDSPATKDYNTSKNYKVEMTYDTTKGVVSLIKITAQ